MQAFAILKLEGRGGLYKAEQNFLIKDELLLGKLAVLLTHYLVTVAHIVLWIKFGVGFKGLNTIDSFKNESFWKLPNY